MGGSLAIFSSASSRSSNERQGSFCSAVGAAAGAWGLETVDDVWTGRVSPLRLPFDWDVVGCVGRGDLFFFLNHDDDIVE